MASVKQDINVGLVAFIGAVGALVLLIVVLGVQAWYGYETDAIRAERYDTDQNVDWQKRRDEQYANLGDTVGNGTIYAHAPTPTPTPTAGEGVSGGYRWTSEARDTAIIPIHAAMAAYVEQNGGPAIDAEAMRALDRGLYVHLSNDAFADPQSYVADEEDDAGNESN